MTYKGPQSEFCRHMDEENIVTLSLNCVHQNKYP